MKAPTISKILSQLCAPFDKEKTIKKIIKVIPIVLIAIAIINLMIAWLNSRELQIDINDCTNRRMDADKTFASVGITLESFERPIKASEIPTRPKELKAKPMFAKELHIHGGLDSEPETDGFEFPILRRNLYD